MQAAMVNVWEDGGEERSLNDNLDDTETVEKEPAGRALQDREAPKEREAPKNREAPKRVRQTGRKVKRPASWRRRPNNPM